MCREVLKKWFLIYIFTTIHKTINTYSIKKIGHKKSHKTYFGRKLQLNFQNIFEYIIYFELKFFQDTTMQSYIWKNIPQ